MSDHNEQHGPDYVMRAVEEFQDIMASNHKNMLEDINRANKGELFVLQFLAKHASQEVLPSELSAALGASSARISALLGALEKKGQIVRDIDKNNRRNILVSITPEGRERTEAETSAITDSMTRVFADMGEADTAAFLGLTRRFSALMQRHAPGGEGRERGK